MTNAEIIQAIRTEIERRKKEIHATIFNDEFDSLLSFLSTLESEKPMQEELEKAVVDYFEGYWPGMETAEQCNTDLRFTPPAIMRLARHFAQWGYLRAAEKADEIEYNRQRAEESVPKDLEEAARQYFENPKNSWEVREVFIAGAKWQKEQDTREMIMSDRSYFQKCYELGKKDILSKFTKKHLEGLKWIERTGISTQPVPYHKYCKDLYKVLEEILKEKYDTQGDTSI